jgi:hypothetical protein
MGNMRDVKSGNTKDVPASTPGVIGSSLLRTIYSTECVFTTWGISEEHLGFCTADNAVTGKAVLLGMGK